MKKYQEIRKPEKDVEYTFEMRPRVFSILVYVGVSENGRLRFYNKRYASFTTMTPQWFSKLHRFNLVSQKHVIQEQKKTNPNDDQSLNIVKNANSEVVKKLIGRSKTSLLSDLKALKKNPRCFSQDETISIMKDFFKVKAGCFSNAQ